MRTVVNRDRGNGDVPLSAKSSRRHSHARPQPLIGVGVGSQRDAARQPGAHQAVPLRQHQRVVAKTQDALIGGLARRW